MSSILLKFKKRILVNKGFTLVEVLAAVTLMAVSLLLIVQLLTYSMQFNKNSSNVSIANNLAQAKIDEYTDKNIAPVTANRNEEPLADVSGYSGFKRKVDLEVGGSIPTDIIKVIVTVTWTGKNGSAESVVLKTFKLK